MRTDPLRNLGIVAWAIGILGFAIALLLNLAGLYLYDKPSAVFFSNPWWSMWFPSYIAPVCFLVIAIGLRIGRPKAAQRHSQNLVLQPTVPSRRNV